MKKSIKISTENLYKFVENIMINSEMELEDMFSLLTDMGVDEETSEYILDKVSGNM